MSMENPCIITIKTNGAIIAWEQMCWMDGRRARPDSNITSRCSALVQIREGFHVQNYRHDTKWCTLHGAGGAR